MYETLNYKIEGIAPLIMHNGQLADPLNDYAKALKKLSGNKKKTDATHEEMARVEFMGGLYVDDDLRPCIPGSCLEAVITEAAKEKRQGKDAKRGVICDGNFPIKYDGPIGADELWDDKRFRDRRAVRIKQVRIMRTRPIFKKWSADVSISYLPDVFNESDVNELIERAGMVGLMDYRPRFGRFEVA